jgi:hypothetical protein
MVPNTLLWPPLAVGALDLGIELSVFLDTPLEVNALMGLKMVFINTNDYGSPHLVLSLTFLKIQSFINTSWF